MSRVRYEITALLHVLSPLHVGSGGTRSLTRAGAPGDNAPEPDVAAIARDGNGTPYLPSSSLKGVLRREAENLFPPEQPKDSKSTESRQVQTLFGTIRKGSGTSVEDGQMGLVHFRGASASALAQTSEAPYGSAVGPGVFILARTAIDPATGTAADHRLFFREAIAPGAQFPFRADIEARGPEAEARAKSALDDLLLVLARLTVPEGIAFGASQADGDGRLRLDPASLGVSRRAIAADGSFDAEPLAVTLPAPGPTLRAARVEAFHLTCPGPFLVVDSSRSRKGGPQPGEAKRPITPQTLDGKTPFIGGAGISGALRSRAAWLQQLQGGVADDERALCRRPADLSPVQRLFGVTGFRGLVTVRAIRTEGARPWQVMSVKLDRFSGAPMDNQLFTTQAFVGTTLSFELEIGARTVTMQPTQADMDLFDRLCDDVRRNGLELGHGTSKGFGWFQALEATR